MDMASLVTVSSLPETKCFHEEDMVFDTFLSQRDIVGFAQCEGTRIYPRLDGNVPSQRDPITDRLSGLCSEVLKA